MTKRHRKKKKYYNNISKHENRVRDDEKTDCIYCSQKFTPGSEGDNVCHQDACQSLQRNIASGDSDLPSTHPDYYDKTEDPEYLRLISTDDEAISKEKERVITVEKKKKHPQNFLGGKEYTDAPTFTKDQWIEDHDGNIVRTYESRGERAMAISQESMKTRAVKLHLNSVIEKHTRSG
jgi:hypothetical protein